MDDASKEPSGETRFRMVRKFPSGTGETFYAVETADPLTEAEALQVLRDLGQPYPGQRYPNRPTATGGRGQPRENSGDDGGLAGRPSDGSPESPARRSDVAP